MRQVAETGPLFYDLTKEEMEAQCPEYLRAIIRKAFDNKSAGYGPGPTMNDVIKHYEDELVYRQLRASNTDMRINEALDVLMMYHTGGEGYIPWRVPSMVQDSNQKWAIGTFNFEHAKRTHPSLAELIHATGWNI